MSLELLQYLNSALLAVITILISAVAWFAKRSFDKVENIDDRFLERETRFNDQNEALRNDLYESRKSLLLTTHEVNKSIQSLENVANDIKQDITKSNDRIETCQNQIIKHSEALEKGLQIFRNHEWRIKKHETEIKKISDHVFLIRDKNTNGRK